MKALASTEAPPPGRMADRAGAGARFPRGLIQPPGSYRFAADALLLSCFLEAAPGARLLDLGTGCGVVAFGMLLRCPKLLCHGIDVQPELLQSARQNAVLLGLDARFSASCVDLAAMPDTPDGELFAAPGSFDLALANPPYRQRHRGRLPASPARLTALFEQPDTLPAFCAAAARSLAPQGRFGLIYPAARESDLLNALAAAGLAPRRILPVAPRAGEPPSLLLLEARKTRTAGETQPCKREAPLPMHEGHGRDSRLSPQALAFCPFLA